MVKTKNRKPLKRMTIKKSQKKKVIADSIKKNPKKPPKTSFKENLGINKKATGLSDILCKAALKILDNRKAEDITVFDLRKKSSETDYLIIASGHASRQVSAIAHYLKEEFLKIGISDVRIEGLPQANWVLVDAGDIIVHLFRPEVRQYYNLESIWDNSNVKKRSRN